MIKCWFFKICLLKVVIKPFKQHHSLAIFRHLPINNQWLAFGPVWEIFVSIEDFCERFTDVININRRGPLVYSILLTHLFSLMRMVVNLNSTIFLCHLLITRRGSIKTNCLKHLVVWQLFWEVIIAKMLEWRASNEGFYKLESFRALKLLQKLLLVKIFIKNCPDVISLKRFSDAWLNALKNWF